MIHAGVEITASDTASFDDYRLVRPLGRSGATFLAHDGSLDRAVVLSFLPRRSGRP